MQKRLGKRLKAARRQAGLTQEQLSAKMGFKDRQTLAAIEAGRRKISAEELVTAMEVLGHDMEYFTDPFRLEGEGEFSWCTSNNSSDVSGFEQSASTWVAMYRHLSDNREYRTAPLGLSLTAKSSHDDAHDAAEWLWREWDLGDVPATRLQRAAEERLGALVLHVDAPDYITAAACRLPQLGTIFINRNESPGWRSFALAHELFHLLTWETMQPDACENRMPWTTSKREEQLAGSFASALLMPEKGVRGWWDTVGANESEFLACTRRLASTYQVNEPAAYWRLSQLDLIGRKQSPESWPVREAQAEYNPPAPYSRRFLEVVARGIDDGKVSVRRTCTVLDTTIQGLAALFSEHGLDVPFDI